MNDESKLTGDIADIKAAISKLTEILTKLDTEVKIDLGILKTKIDEVPKDNLKVDVGNIKDAVDKIPTDNLKNEVGDIKRKVDEIPSNNSINDIEKSLNSVVISKLNDTHDSVKEIPTNNSLDSVETKLSELKNSLEGHINWNRDQSNGHTNWRVDRLRKEEFNKLVDLLRYAFGLPFSDTDRWTKHRSEKLDQAIKEYFS